MMRQVRRILKSVALLSVLIVAAGCVSSYVLIGKQRPPIDPSQVKIYLHPPASYEEIATLSSSSRASFSFTAQGKSDKVIERMKGVAAKLGANGVLLQGISDRPSGSIGTGFGSAGASGNSVFGVGIGGSVATYQKQGSGLAIYVPDGQ